MEYIEPTLTTQVTFVLLWMSSTHYLLYPEDTYHSDQFHLTILMKCLYINCFSIYTNPWNSHTPNQLGIC